MRYVAARLDQEFRETAYRVYVTDSLQAIPQQKYRKDRYADMIGEKAVQIDVEEIVNDVVTSAGLVKK